MVGRAVFKVERMDGISNGSTEDLGETVMSAKRRELVMVVMMDRIDALVSGERARGNKILLNDGSREFALGRRGMRAARVSTGGSGVGRRGMRRVERE